MGGGGAATYVFAELERDVGVSTRLARVLVGRNLQLADGAETFEAVR